MSALHVSVHARVLSATTDMGSVSSWCTIRFEGGEVTFFTDTLADAEWIASAFNTMPSKVTAKKKEEEDADRLHPAF